MNVDLTGSQPSEPVEGASTWLTRDALSQLRSPKASDLARSWVVSSNKKKGDSGRGPGKVSKKSKTSHLENQTISCSVRPVVKNFQRRQA